MSILDKAKEWTLDNLVDEDTLAILLVGSWARGEGGDVDDIDLVVIKEAQLVAMYHQEEDQDDYSLDIWIHNRASLEEDLFSEMSSLTQVINASLSLKFLEDLEVWYEDEPIVDDLMDLVSDWEWDPSVIEFLEFDAEKPTSDWLRVAYEENQKLLDAAKTRIQEGKPVTHRRKDYPELVGEATEEQAKRLLDLTQDAYESLNIERNWPEFGDAKKALATERYGVAVAMLKDVLRFIIRYELPAVPEELLDPSLWKRVEDMGVSDPTSKALKIAYSR